MQQIRREFSELDAGMRADKENRLDTKVEKTPRNKMAEVLKFGQETIQLCALFNREEGVRARDFEVWKISFEFQDFDLVM